MGGPLDLADAEVTDELGLEPGGLGSFLATQEEMVRRLIIGRPFLVSGVHKR
jgi:hypothetical protein